MIKIKSKIALTLVAALLLSGCQKADTVTGTKENQKQSIVSQENTNQKYSTIADLKKKYGVEDSSEIKPLYNVPKDMKFTFKFKSKVDPFKAVTVHTDKSCNIDSMMNLTPAGFSTPYGEDVLIYPDDPVLNTTDRLDYQSDDTYGYAPIYYLCIRYDMESQDVKELEQPIIIPFTLKGDVQTPTAYPEISTDGMFSIKINPVEDADSYRIYEAYVSSSDQDRSRNLLRRENAYVGEHLHLLDEIPADQTTFTNFGQNGTSNLLTDAAGNVFNQNSFSLNNYYITAVKNGKESFFSQEISGWQYNHQLPKSFDAYNGFKRDDSYVIDLPETVKVQMVDGNYTDMPINFKKTDNTYQNLEGGNDCATYEYEIVGTKLKGTINYHSSNKEYPDEIISTATPNYGLYSISLNMDAVPEPELPTINDDNYKNRYVDLTKSAKYHRESMVTYNQEALQTRADMEAERMLLSGQYQRDPFSIDYVESFGLDMDPVYDDANPIETEPVSTETNPVETTVAETEETTETIKPSQETEHPNKNDEITASNLIEEQINSTQNQVAEGNSEQYTASGYPSFAETAEEEYIAEQLINRNEKFSTKAFPSLQDIGTLQDVLMKVYYQNPYVFGFSEANYDPYSMDVYITYNLSKEEIEKRQEKVDKESDRIINEIIKPSMNEDDKVKAIYDYLENSTEYDHDALEAAEASGFQSVVGFEDSFNTYGILCKKKGVCQSYAYATNLLCKKADVNSIMITGYMTTLPHAWNAIEYDNAWYWIDTTNNGKSSGIPYMLYQTSSDTAENMFYTKDNGFELDSKLNDVINNDSSKDWYVKENLIANSENELIEKVTAHFNGSGPLAVRYTFDLDIDEDFMTRLANELIKHKVDLTNTNIGSTMNYFIITN